MMNMQHCRFENTLAALHECKDALALDGVENLSDSEKKAAKKLIAICAHIANWYGEEE